MSEFCLKLLNLRQGAYRGVSFHILDAVLLTTSGAKKTSTSGAARAAVAMVTRQTGLVRYVRVGHTRLLRRNLLGHVED